jgi:YD repeat-containing protein
LVRNAAGQTSTVRDSYGRALAFTYSGNTLASVTTPDGTRIAYGYSISGQDATTPDRLASVTYSTTPATGISYLYENTQYPFQLTGLLDENGVRFTTWAYDGANRVTSSQHAGGADATTLAYDDTDGSRTVTNALGQQEVYKFATLQGVPKVTEIDRLATSTTAAAARMFTYDANGYPASATDWNGNLTTYANDARGLPLSTVEAAGTAAARTTATTWASGLHVPLTVVTPGLTTNFTYDALGEPLTRVETDTAKGGARRWS